jgi:hypothetical protein
MKPLYAIGLLLTVLVTSYSFAAEPVKVIPPQQKTLSTDGGRFVFGQISEMRRDQYMLDTKTGKLWRTVNMFLRDKEGKALPGEGFLVLEAVLYTDSNEKLSAEPR